TGGHCAVVMVWFPRRKSSNDAGQTTRPLLGPSSAPQSLIDEVLGWSVLPSGGRVLPPGRFVGGRQIDRRPRVTVDPPGQRSRSRLGELPHREPLPCDSFVSLSVVPRRDSLWSEGVAPARARGDPSGVPVPRVASAPPDPRALAPGASPRIAR